MLKKIILFFLLIIHGFSSLQGQGLGERPVMMAQNSNPTGVAEGIFKGRIYNKEYSVFIQMNLYEETTKIPGQDVLGNVYGYLKKTTDSRVWAVMDVKISADGKKATLGIVNDYGSEDLNAELTFNKDGTYTLRQLDGSTIKVAGNKKWIKLPKELIFTKQ